MKLVTKENLWKHIVEEGEKIEKGYIANKFNEDDVNTILATMEFFGATDVWLKQTFFDLTIPKFRLFDWLAMCVMSRNDDNRERNNQALKVLVYVWLNVEGNPVKFIEDLRINDYQIDTKWESIEIDGVVA